MRVAKVESAPVQKAQLLSVPSLNSDICKLPSSRSKLKQTCQDNNGNYHINIFINKSH